MHGARLSKLVAVTALGVVGLGAASGAQAGIGVPGGVGSPQGLGSPQGAGIPQATKRPHKGIIAVGVRKSGSLSGSIIGVLTVRKAGGDA
jgi:hypothetical protein